MAIPSKTRAGEFDVSTPILDRGRELYLPDSSNPAPPRKESKVNVVDSYIDSALMMVPGIGPTLRLGLEGLKTQGLDPANILKGKKIEELTSPESQIQDGYRSSTNKYDGLNEADRLLYGITDDNLTDKLISDQADGIKRSSDYKELRADPKGRVQLEKYIKENGGKLSTGLGMQEINTELQGVKTATKEIEGMVDGAKLLDAAREKKGGELTTKDLRSLKPQVQQLQPEELRLQSAETRAGKESTSRIKVQEGTLANAEQQTANAKEFNEGQLGIQQGQLDLNTTKQTNDLLQQQYENEFRTGKLAHDAAEADKQRAFTATENAAQRATQMEINLLGREDTREQREYDRSRDERQDRQLMILQMMKGLQQLGGSFSI